MKPRKNKKRIDPRYFLNETAMAEQAPVRDLPVPVDTSTAVGVAADLKRRGYIAFASKPRDWNVLADKTFTKLFTTATGNWLAKYPKYYINPQKPIDQECFRNKMNVHNTIAALNELSKGMDNAWSNDPETIGTWVQSNYKKIIDLFDQTLTTPTRSIEDLSFFKVAETIAAACPKRVPFR